MGQTVPQSLVGRNRMNIRTILHAVLLLIACNVTAADQKDNYKPEAGYVPDEKTAIQIAVAIWVPIYGAEKIASEKPYHAKLNNGVWIVEGSLPEGMLLGGVAIAEISKKDGRILRVSHGK